MRMRRVRGGARRRATRKTTSRDFYINEMLRWVIIRATFKRQLHAQHESMAIGHVGTVSLSFGGGPVVAWLTSMTRHM